MPTLATLQTRLAALRGRLEREYGWTRLDLSITLADERVILTGEVAALGLAARIREALADALAPGVTLDLDLSPLPPIAWHSLREPVTRLWRQHPNFAGSRELATELWPSEGPVALLARDRAVVLLRARDGTLGWTLDPIGEPTPPRPITAARERADAAARVLAAARGWLGTPYLLGGSSREHIDCSALVQRAFDEALGLILPKNSNDQRACAGGGRELDDEGTPELGDLLFIHSRRERRTHVGLASERGTVVQASRTRSAVVEIALDDYLADAGWRIRVPLVDVLAWARTQVGREAIELPVRR
ncbi:C40 family peptidase [Nannocystaceae bacterium ST9]